MEDLMLNIRARRFSRKLLFIPLLLNGVALVFHTKIPVAVDPRIIVAALWFSKNSSPKNNYLTCHVTLYYL